MDSQIEHLNDVPPQALEASALAAADAIRALNLTDTSPSTETEEGSVNSEEYPTTTTTITNNAIITTTAQLASTTAIGASIAVPPVPVSASYSSAAMAVTATETDAAVANTLAAAASERPLPTPVSVPLTAAVTAGTNSTSSAGPAPISEVTISEQPLLASLNTIKLRLTMLKKDRKNYYRPEDITSLYAQLSQTVYDLERLREEEHRDADDYVNRTDFVLDDVYQLFSLFYMALGKNREIPATYVQLVTIKQSLLLFQEHGVFTTDDLMPYKKRLNDIQSIVERTLAAAAAAVADSSDKLNVADTGPTGICAVDEQRGYACQTKLVARKLRFCQKLADSLMASAQINDPMMMDIHKRLIEIRRRLFTLPLRDTLANTPATTAPPSTTASPTPSAPPPMPVTVTTQPPLSTAATAGSVTAAAAAGTPGNGSVPPANSAAPTPNTQSANEELRQIQRALLEIDNMRMDGKFYAPDGSIPAGQAQIIGLLEQIFDEAHDVQAANDMVPEALRPIFVQLMDIKQNLERLLMTHRWTLRETDLWSYQVQLGEIRALRRNGKFYDTSGPKPVAPKEGQATLNFLLHKGYHLVYKLLSSSEPVSEALTPIHNQLRTLRTVLLAVKKYGGPFSRRDLYPYQLKLSSLDALRVDGKFVDEQGNVPEGQGIVLSLLNECHDIVMELSNNIE